MRRACTALVLSGLVVGLSGCAGDAPDPAPSAGGLSSPSPARSGGTVTAARTVPVPAGQAPAAGVVERAPGPFDDRFDLTGLALRSGTVTGSLAITSDVSDLLVLEVHAAFYGAGGALLGTAVQVEREYGEGGHSSAGGLVPVSIVAPAAYRSRVVSARVFVPVLVNE